MSKRLIVKLTVMVAALSAVIILPGCSNKIDSTVLSIAWTPMGAPQPQGNPFAPNPVTGAPAAASASSGGGQSVASAVASAAGGGAGGVSSGGTGVATP